MRFKSILKGLLPIAGMVNPAIGTALGIVNKFLPVALPENATAEQVSNAYDTLSPDQQAAADNRLELELGLKQEDTKQLQALAEVDMAGASTRPKIASDMSKLLIAEILLFTVFIFWVLIQEGTEGLAGLTELWMVFGILTATPVGVVMTYFNARSKEKRTRYAVAHGQSANLVGSIMGLFKRGN